jgi:hypothetical protein
MLFLCTPILAVDESKNPSGNPDLPIFWIKMGVVIDVGNPGEPDDVQASSGYVIFDEDLYKFWYSAFDGSTTSIMYATSPDGLTFTKHGIVMEPGDPGDYDDDFARDPMVLRNDQGTYEMWYTGQKKSVWGWRILYATSDDGINWQKHGVVFTKTHLGLAVAHPNVLIDDSGTYRMWFSEYDMAHWRIRCATSNDGMTWTDQGLALDIGDPGDPDDRYIYMPSVLIEPDGTYVMFYSASDGNPYNYVEIYYATSPTGLAGSWTKQGLSLKRGEEGDYDEIQAIRPTITMRLDGLFELWYSGYDGSKRRMMLALGTREIPINLTTSVVNDRDIMLNWTNPDYPFLDHYLIYRSPDQRSFDFSNWFHNTSSDPNPLDTSWVDVGVAAPDSPQELYYVVRAVYSYGGLSTTSNTAGKWTMRFDEGLTSFSLPLEPFEERNISWYVQQIPDLKYMSWLGAEDRWVVHSRSLPEGINDTSARFGLGFELFFDAESGYTFCGMPGSMIRFREGLGESSDWARSLSATYDGGSVALNWYQTLGASRYDILKSDKREGLHDLTLAPIASVSGGVTQWVDWNPFEDSFGGYYMIVAVDSSGVAGSSTYSVGVEIVHLEKGIHSYGPRLDLYEKKDLHVLCNEHLGMEGIAYIVSGVWKFHAAPMPPNAYNTDVVQGSGYLVSMRWSSKIDIVEIGY